MVKIIALKQKLSKQQIYNVCMLSDRYVLYSEKNVEYLNTNNIDYEIEKYQKICLLDLNKTLAEQCKYQFGNYDVAQDIYSQELAKKLSLQNWFIIIITARPIKYQKETIKRIHEQVPFLDYKHYVPNQTSKQVHYFKSEYAGMLIKNGVPASALIGIESNANTRREYLKYGVYSLPRKDFLQQQPIKLHTESEKNISDNKGIVYILSNPAMPDFIKVGITNNLKNRLSQLDNTSVPLPFTCVYAVEISDYKKKEQALLKSFGNINGIRIRSNREFLRTEPKTIIGIMETWDNAEVIVDDKNNIGLEYITDTIDKNTEMDIQEQSKINQKRTTFKFSEYNIPVGTQLFYLYDNSITCTIVADRKVKYQGEILSPSKSADMVLKSRGLKGGCSGYEHWSLDGKESLAGYRKRIDSIEDDDD